MSEPLPTVGVRELKSHLSQYLARVKSGEVVVVTEHHRPIARLIPVRPPAVTELLPLLESGEACWSGGRPHGSRLPATIQGERTVADRVAEDRR